LFRFPAGFVFVLSHLLFIYTTDISFSESRYHGDVLASDILIGVLLIKQTGRARKLSLTQRG
jgi:hypothetical protein